VCSFQKSEMALLCLRENGHHWKEINYKLFVEQKDILDSSESMLPVEGSVTDPIEYILQCKTPTNRPNLCRPHFQSSKLKIHFIVKNLTIR